MSDDRCWRGSGSPSSTTRNWRAPWCASTWRRMPDVEVVAECANGFEAVKAVSDLQPDLLLLDVQMPKLDGFEVLELVGRDVAVVFVTAYDQYALRAFEVHAVDYLLKPFSAERLAAALERARERLGRHEPLPIRELAAAARPTQSYTGRILVRDGPRVHVMPVEQDRLRPGAGRLRLFPV